MKFNNQQHSFHLVHPSPWPLLTSISAFFLTTGMVMYMHYYENGALILKIGVITLLLNFFFWWRDVIKESKIYHSDKVKQGLRYGVALFIVSEIMFFFAFFWAYFHSSLAPTIEIGSIWPPVGIKPFSPYEIPLLNTVILLLSGATITMAHHALLSTRFIINEVVQERESIRYVQFPKFMFDNEKRKIYYEIRLYPLSYILHNSIKIGFLLTLFLAFLFTAFQVYEYQEAPFSINSGIFGSVFFMATGFHGFHVLIGTIFLFVNYIRYRLNHFTYNDHFGFEAAIWYWHFVDVVWLFLYITVYIWSAL